MKKVLKLASLCMLIIYSLPGIAQKEIATSGSFGDLTWREAASKMPAEWYNSDNAKMLADSVLTYQTPIGGWSKNHDYAKGFNQEEWDKIKSSGIGATFDNGATLTEMRFLAKMYEKVKDERYLKAFNKGFNYILEAQYDIGGWPQFYPVRPGKTISYSAHITYNDNAMVNVMEFLKDIATDNPVFASMQVGEKTREKAKRSFEKGMDCILKTQIRVKNQPTVWCAQHDEVTLEPANARAYELASFSGFESVGLTLLLMEIDNPSKEIIAAVKGAVKWFEQNKITGIRIDTEPGADKKKNKIVVKDNSASPIWARFYDLQTSKPYFCDRDGVKKYSLAEIGFERRNGYSWYTNAPEKIFKRYPEWAKKWGVN